MKNKLAILSLVAIASFTTAKAQDIETAKKTIDAEKYESAKKMLKSLVASNDKDGMATFLLGNVYLTQGVEDSAQIYYNKGVGRKDYGNLNQVGLGQIDLNNGNVSGAQAKFDDATKDMRRRDFEEFMYIGKAYTNSTKPNYAKAVETIKKAVEKNPTDAQVQLALGDAYYGLKDQNNAYASYRNAFNADNSLIRAKMQLGVLLKGAKAYNEAVKAYDEVIALNANYGPVYRELAETYYYWANNEPRKYNEYIQKALPMYEKYMKLTDYSINSRMRHADFLILAKDYKALEVEANEMQKLDKVNPRIMRYLGYSAYENGNYDNAIKGLNDFIANPKSKVIARDYLYLGLAKLKKSSLTSTIDETLFTNGVADVQKSVSQEPTMSSVLSELGTSFYEKSQFSQAVALYSIAVSNKESKSFLTDNFYLANSIYFANAKKDAKTIDPAMIEKANVAYDAVTTASPTTQDAFLYQARTNNLIENDAKTVVAYEGYVKAVSDKGADEINANKKTMIEAFNNIGAIYANSDKAKAVEFFNKTLALDSTNDYAAQSIKQLR